MSDAAATTSAVVGSENIITATENENHHEEKNFERIIEKLVVTTEDRFKDDDTATAPATIDVMTPCEGGGGGETDATLVAASTTTDTTAVNGDNETTTTTNDDDSILPLSDISDGHRRIWIVTTAGLPWMTGTAVNPLLRAVSLAQQAHRPAHYVTLMIPWLVSSEERLILYGTKHVFTCQHDQEMWIRQYCMDRCNCSYEVAYDKLRIQFWLGKYHEAFGSIFPMEDICSTIPRKEADICILEEPEHLNWFRVPAKSSSSSTGSTATTTKKHHSNTTAMIEEKKLELPVEAENPFAIEPGNITTPLSLAALDAATGISSSSSSGTNTIETEGSGVQDVVVTFGGDVVATGIVAAAAVTSSDGTIINDDDIEVLGWAHKFQHVVGILHTNYADYIRQYGMASMVTAPALNALSSLVVKAYCHKVIRLSETLPPLDVSKEVTCNVHGVRHEFLARPMTTKETVTRREETVAVVVVEGKQDNLGSTSAIDDVDEPKVDVEIAPVYFIGKLIWAKGFERVLELQEKYKMQTNEYFSMDIYGGGKDEKEIQTAFFGRNGTFRGSSSSLNNEVEATTSNQQQQQMETKRIDEKAAAVFGANSSIRDQLCGFSPTLIAADDEDYVLVSTSAQPGSSTVTAKATTSQETPDAATSLQKMLATPHVDDILNVVVVEPSPQSAEDGVIVVDDTSAVAADTTSTSPIEVLGDISGKTITTTVDTADATMKLIDSAMKAGLNILSGGNGNSKKKSEANESTVSTMSPKNNNNANSSQQPNPFQNIAPAKTRFKWRRNPVPARFLGVQDHIIVRDISEHKIFLNMSTSEVLCTTSAEALAMGKFVILPRHCSNTFFLQFPNCLSYDSWDECLERLQFALKNDPVPLSDEHRHALSWDGATERLIKSAAITKREYEARKLKGLDKADVKAAQFHVDAGTKSNWLRKKILT